ncbi:peroxiredoxin, partial [Thermoplasma volcanium]
MVRTVFIVDGKYVVRAKLYYPIKIGRNLSEILRMIKALQMVDKYKVETPASRPDNELIKDKSIIPPPVTIDDIPESMKIIQGLCVVANV